MMKLSTGLAVAALLALGACNNPNRPTDTGNMALPSAGQPGVASTTPTARDVGAAQAPTTGGVVSRTMPTTRTPDTGNMALPTAAQGNSTPRSY